MAKKNYRFATVTVVGTEPETEKTTAIIKAPDVEVALQRRVSENILQHAQALSVTGPETLCSANQLLLSIAAGKRTVKEKLDFFVKPLKQHVKDIEALFKPVLNGLEEADGMLRRKVLDYRSEVAAREAEARAAAEEEARKAAEEAERLRAVAAAKKGKRAVALEEKAAAAQDAANNAALEMLAHSGPARVMATTDGQVSTRKVWTFEVVDESLVPRVYLKVEESLIRAAVKAGARQIPGVRIFEEERLAVGGM